LTWFACQLLWWLAGWIASCAKERTSVGCDNPKQQLTVQVRETVPQLFRDEYRRASLEGTTFAVQSECSSLENVGSFVAVKVDVLHYHDLTEQDENPSIRDHLT
jgi:hypothetical protein